MQIPPISNSAASSLDVSSTNKSRQTADSLRTPGSQPSGELKEAFQDFVGQTMFSEMIKSMRTSQQPSAYFNGGRAEEIFRGQLDQVLSEKLSEASASSFADPMFELFMLPPPS